MLKFRARLRIEPTADDEIDRLVAGVDVALRSPLDGEVHAVPSRQSFATPPQVLAQVV
jgi:hypothetical protein